MEKFLQNLENANVKDKVGAAFGSYGWSGEAPVLIAEKMRELGMKVLDPVLRIQYQPAQKDLEECKRLGKDIAVKVKKIPEKSSRGQSLKMQACGKSKWRGWPLRSNIKLTSPNMIDYFGL